MTAFDAAFRDALRDLIVWRRDVRRFRRDAPPPGTIERLLQLASLAPSVGLSQPWRFVVVEDAARRAAVRENFHRCNEAALAAYAGERAQRYATLKLAGLDEAPMHLAAFTDRGTEVARILEVPPEWIFLGYFCLGYPQREETTPELEREAWEQRRAWESFVVRR